MGLGNVLVVCFVLKTQQTRTPFNIMIVAMCLCNLLRCELSNWMDFTELVTSLQVRSYTWCYIKLLFQYIALYFNLFLMSTISLWRVYVLCFQKQKMKFLYRHAVLMMVCVGIFSSAISMIYGTNLILYNSCFPTPGYIQKSTTRVVVRFSESGLRIFCCLVIFISNISIILIYKYKKRKLPKSSNELLTVRSFIIVTIGNIIVYVIPLIFQYPLKLMVHKVNQKYGHGEGIKSDISVLYRSTLP